MVMQVIGRIPLRNGSLAHHTDAVGDGEGFGLVVRDQDGRVAGGLENVPHFERQAFARVHIQVRKRFVQQQQIG
ncbi:hypothetical protein G6F59_018850 [Rhizopus arrhizus]|nr:hypothetical protein G6F59_018850 [Rhizopus arrhizus]